MVLHEFEFKLKTQTQYSNSFFFSSQVCKLENFISQILTKITPAVILIG